MNYSSVVITLAAGADSRALKNRDQRYLENLLAEGDRIKRALDDEASH